MTGTVAPGYWFNNNSMTCMVATQWRMTYGIGAGNSSTLGHGTGGNVQFHLVRWRIQESLRWWSNEPYWRWLRDGTVWNDDATSFCILTLCSVCGCGCGCFYQHSFVILYTDSSDSAMTTGGDNQENGCSWIIFLDRLSMPWCRATICLSWSWMRENGQTYVYR